MYLKFYFEIRKNDIIFESVSGKKGHNYDMYLISVKVGITKILIDVITNLKETVTQCQSLILTIVLVKIFHTYSFLSAPMLRGCKLS